MEIENYINSLDHKVKSVLEIVPAGSFIYANQTLSGLEMNGTIAGTIGGAESASFGLTLGATAAGKFFATETTNYRLSTRETGVANPQNLWAVNNGTTAYNLGISATAPQKPVLMDNCSGQFFTATALGNELARLFNTNNLTGVVTAPNLLNEYRSGHTTTADILFKNNWQILKTDSLEISRNNIGENEAINYVTKNKTLRETAFIITDDKGAIKKIIDNGLNYLKSWDLVIAMVIRKIINWFKAEEIYNTKYKVNGRNQNFQIPLPAPADEEKYYKSLQQYYIDNQCEIEAKFEKLIK